ncbi:uncharacterized protein [Drosophila takahashii]|uniref:uncharacterized protein n=1 Tax=Drosophila takahashii TaxID=29030 RepID=UPI0038990F44
MSQGEQDHNEVNQVEKDQLMDQNEKAAGSAENLKTLLGALKLVPRVPTPEIQVADTNIDCSLLTKNNEDDSGNGPEIKQEETSSECSWLTVNSEDTSSECSWLTINSEDTSFVNVPNPEGVSIPSQEKIQNHSKISENAEKEMSISPQSLDFSPLQNDIFPEEDIQKNQEMKGSFDYPILESNKLAKTIGSDTLLEDDKSKERLLRLVKCEIKDEIPIYDEDNDNFPNSDVEMPFSKPPQKNIPKTLTIFNNANSSGDISKAEKYRPQEIPGNQASISEAEDQTADPKVGIPFSPPSQENVEEDTTIIKNANSSVDIFSPPRNISETQSSTLEAGKDTANPEVKISIPTASQENVQEASTVFNNAYSRGAIPKTGKSIFSPPQEILETQSSTIEDGGITTNPEAGISFSSSFQETFQEDTTTFENGNGSRVISKTKKTIFSPPQEVLETQSSTIEEGGITTDPEAGISFPSSFQDNSQEDSTPFENVNSSGAISKTGKSIFSPPQEILETQSSTIEDGGITTDPEAGISFPSSFQKNNQEDKNVNSSGTISKTGKSIFSPPQEILETQSSTIEDGGITTDPQAGISFSSSFQDNSQEDTATYKNVNSSGAIPKKGKSIFSQPQKTLETSSIERQKELKKMEVNDDIYYIKRDDGSVHEGRLLKFRKSENPVMPDEYYVRYIGFNKKLDAWVGVHRISDKAEDLGGLKAGQMKNTPSAYRLQKRKNKEQEYQPMKNIERVQFGRYEIETWYFSPYPKEYGKASIIYVCEFCLKYMKLRKSYAYHLSDCKKRTPPGSLIYQKDDIYIYEVDGNEQKLYCQCLELFSKLFLENKDFFYDPSPFFFYIMCVKDQDGQHFVGYFARDRDSEDNFNVACILVLPPHQRKGYGKLLIALSYEISRREGFIGGPEKPLSAFGRLCYRGYWGYTLLELLRNHSSPEPITIRELSETTGFLKEDILYTLKVMKMIKYYGDDYLVCTMREIIEERLKLPQLRKPKLTIDPKCFLWKAKT